MGRGSSFLVGMCGLWPQLVPGLLVWRWLRLPPLPWLLSGPALRWSAFFALVEATVAAMAKVGVVAVDTEVTVAFLLLRT